MRILLLLICLSISSISLAQGVIPKHKPDISFNELELRENLIGEWYANLATEEGGMREEFAIINRDGTFQFRFTDYDFHGALESTASVTGLWGVAENIFFTMDTMYQRGEQPAFEKDLSDPQNFNAYRILEITETYQLYESLGDKTQFTLIRMN